MYSLFGEDISVVDLDAFFFFPEEVEGDEDEHLEEIKEYLVQNGRYHMGKEVLHHSWPCGIWGRPPGQPGSVTWEQLIFHGLIPRNWEVVY